MRICSSLVIAMIITSLTPSIAHAEKRMAVIVGIDKYIIQNGANRKSRRKFSNLDGAVNDALAIKEVMVNRFNFEESNVTLLTDDKATRASIIGTLESVAEKSTKGDIILFFYAGHGSQMKNTASLESDKKDETIVPADSALGVQDIRDKELAVLFNRILDRKVNLVAILDCCHSGSGARAVIGGNQGKKRSLELSQITINDPEVPFKFPEEREGALIISSAQAFQLAGETMENGRHQGLFTLAFLKSLRVTLPGEPVTKLFLRTRSLMVSNSRDQEPVVSCQPDRLQLPLFGTSEKSENHTFLAVSGVKSSREVILQGGLAMGIMPGCEVSKHGNDGTSTLRISSTVGANGSIAQLIKGDMKNIKQGDLLDVTKWVVPAESLLKIWMPVTNMSQDWLVDRAKKFQSLGNTCNLVSDPTETIPSHTIFWNGQMWQLLATDPEDYSSPVFNADCNVESVRTAILKNKGPVRLFIHLPVPAALAEAIKKKIQEGNNSVSFTNNPSMAHYHLAGRLSNGTVEYTWVHPGRAEEAILEKMTEGGVQLNKRRKKFQQLNSVNYPLPFRSNWIPSGKKTDSKDTDEILAQYAVSLARILGWLKIDNPGGSSAFPYSINVSKPNVRTSLSENSTVHAGDKLVLKLKKNSNIIGDNLLFQPRYVYVFVIDKNGKADLLYPDTGTTECLIYNDKDEIELSRIEVGTGENDTYGLETIVMLSSKTPVPQPQLIFSFDPVKTETNRSRGVRGYNSALEELLSNFASGTRSRSIGGNMAISPDWSVQRITLKSVAAGK